MTRFNLVNFETVCCIARLGTFSAAAERLHASQPAVTARVRELEDSLGITLFQRRGRRMELTIEGRRLIEQVEPLVNQLEGAVLAHADLGAARGIVRIGIAPVALRWFPHVVAQLRAEMPDVQYEVDIDVGKSIVGKLEAGKLDVALIAGDLQNELLVTHALSSEELRWLMAADIPKQRDGKPLPVADILRSAPIWLLPRSSILFPRAAAALRAHGVGLENVNTCTSMAGIIEMAVQSRGIGLMTASAAAAYLDAGLLAEVSGELAPETLAVTLAHHRDQQQAVVRRIVERIVETDRRFHEKAGAAKPRARRARVSPA